MSRLLPIPLLFAIGACADPVDRSTDWNYLHATIIEPNCATAGCHSALTRNGGPLQREVDLSTPTRACCSIAVNQALIDNDACGDLALGDWATDELPVAPEDRPLMLLLRGEPNPERDMFGDEPVEYVQMPVDVPLTPAEIEIIQHWVEEGAPCD